MCEQLGQDIDLVKKDVSHVCEQLGQEIETVEKDV